MKNIFLKLILVGFCFSFGLAAKATDPTQACYDQLASAINLCHTYTGNYPGYYEYQNIYLISEYPDNTYYYWRSGCRYQPENNPNEATLVSANCIVTLPTGSNGPGGPGGPPRCADGSVIRVDELSVGEEVPLVGTPFHLIYTSERVIGHRDSYRIHVKSNTPVSGQTAIDYSFDYQSTRHDTQSTPATSGSSYDFYWDGKDGSGNLIEGRSNVLVTTTLMFGSTPSALSGARTYSVGTWNTIFVGLGGWNLDIHHFYDGLGKIYLGNGSVRDVVAGSVTGGGHYVVSEDGKEIYYFDSNGKHVTTNNALTNATIYTFNHDGNGYLSSVVDAYGNTTTIQRDGSGVLTGIQSPYGQVTSLTLDGNGYLASIENPNGETHTMTYYTGGLLHTFEKPKGQVSTMTYDTNGNLTQDSSSAGNYLNLVLTLASNGNKTINMTTAEGYQSSSVITYSGTNFDRVDVTKSGLSSTFHYFPSSSISHNVSSGSISESTSYGNDGRFGTALKIPTYYTFYTPGAAYKSASYSQTVNNTASPQTPFNYNTIQSQAIVNSKTTTSVYTRTTGTTVTTSPIGRVRTDVTDSYGKLTSSTFAGFLPIEYTYDTRGRLSEIEQGARQTTYAYDSLGNVSSITNPLSEATSFTYDLTGRVLTKTLPDSRVITYTYDSNGNITSVTPPGTNTHSFTLNLFDLNSEYTPPALGLSNVVTEYSYNDDKQLTLVTRPDTSTISYAYNSTSGLLTSITTAAGANNYTLNSKGQTTSMTSTDGITTNQYFAGYFPTTASNTRTSPSLNIGGVTYAYNSDLKPSSLTVNAASGSTSAISFGYDNDGILNSAGDETLTLSSTTGFVTGITLDNIEETLTYDADFGELASSSVIYTPGPTTLFEESVTRDYLGRISTKTETVNGVTNTFSYTYDSAGRLADVVKNSVILSHANYSSNSNRTSGSVLGNAFTATYDDQDRILTYNSNTYTFNLNGELTSKVVGSDTTTYGYDGFGNLKSVTLPSTTVISYLVDGRQRRVGRLTGSAVDNYWVYQDQIRIAAELNSSGVITKRFVYGSKPNVPDYMVVGSDTYRIISDSIGSVRVVVNASTGVVSQKMEYDEYGKVLVDTNPGFQPFGFAGGLYDVDTGLYHFGARDYDPETGRWLSKDPILFGGGDANLYGYVMNDSVNLIDPSGLISGDFNDIIGNQFIGVINYWTYERPRDERRRREENMRYNFPNNTPVKRHLPPPFPLPNGNGDGGGQCDYRAK